MPKQVHMQFDRRVIMPKQVHMQFGDWLCLLFIGLKLTHQIDWSWWWILAPEWAPMLLIMLLKFIEYLCTPSKNKSKKGNHA